MKIVVNAVAVIAVMKCCECGSEVALTSAVTIAILLLLELRLRCVAAVYAA